MRRGKSDAGLRAGVLLAHIRSSHRSPSRRTYGAAIRSTESKFPRTGVAPSARVLDAGTRACDAGFMATLDSERSVPPRLVVGLVLAMLILVFIAENNRRTKMRFLLPEVTAPLWTALFVAALLG